MFKHIKVETQILFSIVILAVMFFALTITFIYSKYQKIVSLTSLENRIVLSIKASKLINKIQKERGITGNYIYSIGEKYHNELTRRRKLTDHRIKELKNFLNSSNIHQYKIEQVIKHLSKIKSTRIQIDNIAVSNWYAIEYYSQLNNLLLDVIVEISKTSNIKEVTKEIIAYSNFLYIKENSIAEREVGIEIISPKHIDHKKINRFNMLIVKQNVYRDIYIKYSSQKSIDYYNKKIQDTSTENVQKIRKVLLSANIGTIARINPTFWFNTVTDKINILKGIDDYLSKNIIATIKNELSIINKSMIMLIFITIVSITIFIFIVGFMLRLIQNEKRLKELIDKYIISSTTDTKGIITDVSSAFCKISGYEKKELIGKGHNIIRHPDMPKSAFTDMWTTIKSAKTWTGEVKNLQKDGGYYWVTAHIEPLFDKRGEIESYIAIRINITDKIDLKSEIAKNRLKDQQLIEQSRLAQMGEMLSMIAHQWRQPLSAISSTAVGLELKAQRGDLNRDKILKLSQNISKYSQHLSQTINDFRDFFKTEKEEVETSYNEMLESVLNIVEVSIENKNIEIIKRLNSEDSFSTYSNEVKQVIINLLKNAEDILLERDIEKGYIKIHTYQKDNRFILEIEDNGGGVPIDIVDKIFNPYFSTKIGKNGTGLGLYMSKTIIEEHCKGTIDIENNDKGAIFRVTLFKY
ncbi:MAG: nitrate- and nitrite sensing domain-containing protein [Sulfurovum sp.]